MGKKKHTNRVSSNKGKTSNTIKSFAATKRAASSSAGIEDAVEEAVATSGEEGNQGEMDLRKAPMGLQNIGNTCFFNSVVQSLFTVHMNLDVNANRNYELPLSTSIAESFHQLHNLKKGNFKPNAIFDNIAKYFPQFKGKRQQDSHELYICLLSRLDDEVKIEKAKEQQLQQQQQQKSQHPDVIEVTENTGQALAVSSASEIEYSYQDGFANRFLSPFEGELCSLVTCSECGRKSATLDPIYDFSLEIPGSAHLMTLPSPRTRKPPPVLGGKEKKKKQPAASVNAFSALSSDEADSVCPEIDKPVDKDAEASEIAVEVALAESLANMTLDPDHTEASSSTDGENVAASDSVDAAGTTLDESITKDASGNSEAAVGEPEAAVVPSSISLPTPAHILAENIIEPPLPTKDGGVSSVGVDPTIFDCLDSFTSEEKLLVSDKNGFDCVYCRHSLDGTNGNGASSCNSSSKVNAVRRISLLHSPRQLVLHLKRLLPGGKFNGFVRFPVCLDMRQYTARMKSDQASVDIDFSSDAVPVQSNGSCEIEATSAAAISVSLEPALVGGAVASEEDVNYSNCDDSADKNEEDADDKQEDDEDANESKEEDSAAVATSPVTATPSREGMYELVAVVVHQGGAWGGHYVAYVSRGQGAKRSWYYASDTSIRRAELSEVLKCQAYMLFYHALWA
jgi:ubiquitin C-terminal hydrolase